jgi:hypothetical protein
MNILKSFEQHIKDEVGVSIERYIDSVNSFPAASILEERRERRHFGGEIHTLYTMQLRGYTHTSVETAIDDTEALARNLELATQSFVRVSTASSLIEEGILTTQSGLELSTQSLLSLASQNAIIHVDDSRVLSITSDEGLFAPYGVCDLMIGLTVVSYS